MFGNKSDDNPAGLFIPAGVIIGMGVGLLRDDVAPWMFIGLGIGFLFMAFSMLDRKK